MNHFKTLKDITVTNKTVLLRLDLNVPKHDGRISDTARIDRAKPTINHLREHGAKIVILSHFGRPEGTRDTSLSLAFLAPALEKSWNAPVSFCQHTIGNSAEKTVQSMQNGDIVLLENIRFHAGEKENDADFVKDLASLGDIYVNDAFSVSHRAHASTVGLANVLPNAAGLLMEAELNALSSALEHPKKPVMAIIGGSKISTKLNVLENLVEKVDAMVLGGGMANTFIYAQGGDIGGSLHEADMKDDALRILKAAQDNNCEMILPIDFTAVSDLKTNAPSQNVRANNVPATHKAVDIGDETITVLTERLHNFKTVLWNGPMGVFEISPFDRGTNAIANAVADMTQSNGMISIAGGGDTMAALENASAANQFTYISTAGGAFLEWLEGRDLPGVKALK